MLNNYIYKKAKNNFLYDIKSNKYYDFRYNTNIIGFSNKKLTHHIKNCISSSLNIKNSIFHNRFKKYIEKKFPDYNLYCFNSLIEFLLLINTYFENIEIYGNYFNKWIKLKNINITNKKILDNKKVNILDCAEFYLYNKVNIIENILKEKENNINILNYYWFPYLNINHYYSSIIILPELYNGNFVYLNVLIRKEFDKELNINNEFNNLPSLYFASSLKMIYLIEKLLVNNKNGIIKFNKDYIIQQNRIFVLNEKYDINNLYNSFQEKKILINNIPPFYNYLPIILEDYQKKFLLKL